MIPSSNRSLFGFYKDVINPDLVRSLFSTSFLLGTLIGLIGSTVILIGTKQKAIKLDKITTALIQHVAVLDLLSTLIILFPTCLTAITDRWLFGEKFCAFQAYSRWFLMSSSILLICALNCSKLAFILFPFRGARWNSRQGHILAGSMWALSGVLNLIFHLQQGGTHADLFMDVLSCDISVFGGKFINGAIMIFTVTLLATVIVVISGIWLIVIAVRLNRQQGRSANLQGILTVILIAVVYCISFLPLFGYYVVMVIAGVEFGYTSMFCKCIPYLNNIANVFIYIISMTSFRKFVKAKFSELFSARSRTIADRRIIRNNVNSGSTEEDNAYPRL